MDITPLTSTVTGHYDACLESLTVVSRQSCFVLFGSQGLHTLMAVLAEQKTQLGLGQRRKEPSKLR